MTMLYDITSITTLLESNLTIAAPLVAFAASWLLYGVLGKRLLGADDDFWPRIRGAILPRLDLLADGTGLYAEGRSHPNEYAGFYRQYLGRLRPGDQPIDPFERNLETAGYTRNPLASFKKSAQGNLSDGSWARRYGYVRGTGDILRLMGANRTPIPIDPRWLAAMLGRFLQALGDILALRQVHVTLYVEHRDEEGVARIHVYAHDEPNSLNPLTALAHYQGHTQRHKRGVRAFCDDMSGVGIAFNERE